MESLNKQEIGFLKEKIESLERRVDSGFAQMNAKLEILIEGYVKKEEIKETLMPLRKDVDGLMADRQWAVRIVLGLIITAVVGTILIINK